MDRKKALEIVKEQITNHRYEHTLGVMETSIELAKRFGADITKAELAAIFHDYAKFRNRDEMKRIIVQQKMKEDLLDFHSELWHAPVGAYLVKEEVGIVDEDVLKAIRFHTTGRPDMTLLEKVVFLADYIEPGRHFPGVDEVRETSKENLDHAVLMALTNTITFLMKKRQPIYPDTFATYNNLAIKANRSD
jgi:predicted HD superfamily hydrolase involved in NAD metabolism